MRDRTKGIRSAALLALVASLGACGGGGGGGTTTTTSASGPTAEGVYGGTLTGSTSSAFQLLVLENGEYWAMYGNNSSSAFLVRGFLQGSGASNSGAFTSANAKDFGFAPALGGTVNATYNAAAPSISGSFAISGQTVGFNGGAIQGSTYNYAAAASLPSVAGSWSLVALNGEQITLVVQNSGAFSATGSSGCNFSGTVAPRPSGKNVFNVTLTFGPSPCALPNQAATGIALTYPLTAGGTQLIVSVVDGTRTYGSAAFGSR